MKKVFLISVLLFFASLAFAEMDADAFYKALNLKLEIAAYGVISVDTDISVYNGEEDENGDGIILAMFTPDFWTNVFAIGNAHNGKYMMIVLTNDSSWKSGNQNGVKVYDLDNKKTKDQFIKDFNDNRAAILGSSPGSRNQNNKSSDPPSGGMGGLLEKIFGR